MSERVLEISVIDQFVTLRAFARSRSTQNEHHFGSHQLLDKVWTNARVHFVHCAHRVHWNAPVAIGKVLDDGHRLLVEHAKSFLDRLDIVICAFDLRLLCAR